MYCKVDVSHRAAGLERADEDYRYLKLLHQSAWSLSCDRLIGLVVKVSASSAADLGFSSCLRQDFSRLSHTSDLKRSTPVATLPDAWHYRVSTGTGWPGVSIM